jgi:hypothetical protein
VVAAVAVLAVVGLVAGLFAVSGDDRDEAGSGTASTSELDDFDAVIAELSDFVEEERGLPFLRPVEVELADDDEFESRLLEDFEEDLDEIAETDLVFTALGLLDSDTDLAEVLRDALAAGVVGFYDPTTDELVVRGIDTTPYVRSTIVHELTHALDDQHFELDRPAIDESDGEEGFGFSALVEGNAVRVEEVFFGTLSSQEQQQYAEEEAELAEGFPQFSIPTVVLETLVAPYVSGPVLVDHILDEGGQSRLDEAFAEPPITSEQVLEPDAFIDGEGPIAVTPPAADAEVASQGAFGAFLLGLVLREEISGSDAREAVNGWGGDAYVAWVDGDRSCIRASFVGDTEDDTGEIASALEEWAEEVEGAEVTSGGGDPVTVTRCD